MSNMFISLLVVITVLVSVSDKQALVQYSTVYEDGSYTLTNGKSGCMLYHACDELQPLELSINTLHACSYLDNFVTLECVDDFNRAYYYEAGEFVEMKLTTA